MRDALGLDPYSNPAADRPMVLTATGYVPIEAGASSPAGLTRGSMLPHRSNEAFEKYSADQPRVPAGNSDGGQWTSGGLNDAPGDLSDGSDGKNGAKPDSIIQPVRYASLDTGMRTDAMDGGTSPGGNSSNSDAELAQNKVTPRGFTIQQGPGENYSTHNN